MEPFTWGQWKILIICAGCHFMGAVIYSLQAPFYPAEAERQGASITFAGLVLGIYELAGFVACPLISSMLLHRLGSYICFHLGLLTTGTTTLLFGFLNRLTDTTTFVSLSLVLRILEAAGTATTIVSNLVFLNAAFPDSIATAVGLMETIFAVGMALGPPLGEAIYQLGGGSELWSFTLPFLTIGIMVYTSLTLSSCILWPMKLITEHDNRNSGNERLKSEMEDGGVVLRPTEEIQDGGKKEGFFALLKVPRILIFYLAVMVGSIGLGFITCTLEAHLRQFHLTPIQAGGMFFIFGGLYAGFSPVWGVICDRIQRPILVTLIGCLLSILAFTFMGPSILIPLKPSTALTGVSLAAFGLGLSGIYISTFLLMINEAKHQGFPDTNKLTEAISALYLSAMHLGCLIGPILGGVLFEKFGFGVETVVPVVLTGVTFVLLSVIGLNPSSSPSEIIHQADTEETSLLQTTTVPVHGK